MSLTRESRFVGWRQFHGWVAVRKCVGSGGGVRLNGDVEAELLDLAGEASGMGLGIGAAGEAAGEVVDPELGVGLVLGEDVPGDYQHGVRDSEDCLGVAPAAEAP